MRIHLTKDALYVEDKKMLDSKSWFFKLVSNRLEFWINQAKKSKKIK